MHALCSALSHHTGRDSAALALHCAVTRISEGERYETMVVRIVNAHYDAASELARVLDAPHAPPPLDVAADERDSNDSDALQPSPAVQREVDSAFARIDASVHRIAQLEAQLEERRRATK